MISIVSFFFFPLYIFGLFVKIGNVAWINMEVNVLESGYYSSWKDAYFLITTIGLHR